MSKKDLNHNNPNNHRDPKKASDLFERLKGAFEPEDLYTQKTLSDKLNLEDRLLIAISLSPKETIEDLLTLGANPNAVNSKGMSALQLALVLKREDIAELLNKKIQKLQKSSKTKKDKKFKF